MATVTGSSDKSVHALFCRRWRWLFALAFVQLLTGAVAIVAPVLTGLLAIAVFGWVLIVSGTCQIVHAVQVREWAGFLLHLLSGFLYGTAGVLVLLYPFAGVLTLPLFLAGLLLADGVARLVLVSLLNHRGSQGWFLAAALVTMAIGVVLIFGSRATALWALGLALGTNLVFSGVMNAALAIECRGKQQQQPHDDAGSKHAAAGTSTQVDCRSVLGKAETKAVDPLAGVRDCGKDTG